MDRRSPQGLVDQIAELFAVHENLIIAVTPESTRRKTDHWKSGFYHIACKAQVPILLCYIDYAQKQVGIGPSLLPTGDVVRDMDTIREFYHDLCGANPEMESTIALKEEQHGR